MSGLNKLVLNNFIVKNRPAIRKGKAHLANRLIKRSRELRKSKVDNDLKKNKNCRKADKLIEEIRMLRKFYDDDVTKYALLNKKTLLEVSNDASSTLEERALCRVATYKAVATEIEKFRNQYPDWDKKVPQLLKTMGLQYRKKKLKKLDVQGKKETFLEKEHHSTCILQQLTNLEVDRRLLAKTSQMLEDSKKEESDAATERSKSKRKDQNKESSEQECLAKIDSSSKMEEITGQIPNKKLKKEDKKLSKKKPKKEEITKVKNIVSENANSGTSSLEGKFNGKQEKYSVEDITHSEGILDKPPVRIKRKVKKLAENVSEDEGISGDDSTAEESEEEEPCKKGSFMKEEIDDVKGSHTEESISDDGDDISEQEEGTYNTSSEEDEYFTEDASSGDDDGSNCGKESDFDISESGGDVRTESRSIAKKKENLNKKTKSTKHGSKSTQKHNDEASEVSDAEGSVDFDSEGSIIDENFVGEEVTSIWDDLKEKDKGKSRGKSSNPQLNSKDKFGSSDIIKNKGTVKIRRLNLTDQKSVEELLRAHSGGDTSGSEEEDFFVRPVAKKRKKSTKSVDDENDGEVRDNDENDKEGGDDSDENRADARERYIDKSFKKIWGKGMEETIKVSRGRRGIYGRGRGGGRGFDGYSREGFERNRGRGFGGGRGRGFGQENANFLPLGSKLPLDQGFGAYRNNAESKMESDSRPGKNFKQFSSNERFETSNRGQPRDI